MGERKRFTSEFKREAVRLMDSSEKPSSEIARQLGVRRNQLYKWKDQLSKRGAKAFGGPGRRSEAGDEVGRLKRELEQVKEERDILKKAAAYFAKELG
ncbi:MAG TPA: transposase [Candidatus Polarisedimenticolaceae bacterium]|nr:transposase [Candidatus Polarisedimenticolaceae bacterium]